MNGSRRPNVLFFFTDDQRFDTIRALGNREIHTPNIDQLVERGTTFTHAFNAGGTVGAICMPSRAMLHSGRSLFHLQDSGEVIPREHTTMGEALRAAGYRTFGTGKWHNGRESFHRSFSDGDEIFFEGTVYSGMTDHWNVPAYHYDPTGAYEATLPMVEHPERTNQVIHRRCDHVHAGKHSSELVCDAAIRWLRGARPDGETPFFMYVSFLAPHDPRTMPQRFLDMYDPDTLQLPPNFMGGHPFDNGRLHGRDERLAGFPRTPEETRRHIAEYYAMITHLDYEIGRVIDTLKEQGLFEQTLIVFAGDNGLALGQHGLFGKQNCYEHSLRVPLIFAGPGVPRGERRDALVYLMDIYPTVCDLVGVDVPASVEAESLAPVMSDPDATVRETLYFGMEEKHRAVRDSRYKLIEYVVNGRHTTTSLFDLQEDPWELADLSAEPAHSETLARLRAELERYSFAWHDRSSKWGEVFWPAYDERFG